ncbi:MAG: hypothetical protein WD845_15765 [Pirellulales bacterium]
MPYDPADFDQQLEVFFGRTSDAVAYVYARLPGVAADGSWQLRGQLTGPLCRYAETLPAHLPLVDRGAGPSLLAAATVPEPCYWTPEMPHLYDVEVELLRGNKAVANARRVFGFRNLGAAGGKLLYDGKRWVLRAVMAEEVPPAALIDWRDASAAMVVSSLTDALCEEASRVGVLLVAEIATADVGEVRRLSRWPAVGIALLPRDEQLVANACALGHNLLLAERFSVAEPISLSNGISVALVEVDSTNGLASRIASCQVALIAVRAGGPFAGVAQGRGACDALQRDLAGRGDWSGYIV